MKNNNTTILFVLLAPFLVTSCTYLDITRYPHMLKKEISQQEAADSCQAFLLGSQGEIAIEGKVGNQPILWRLDTGAEGQLISERLFNKLEH